MKNTVQICQCFPARVIERGNHRFGICSLFFSNPTIHELSTKYKFLVVIPTLGRFPRAITMPRKAPEPRGTTRPLDPSSGILHR